MNAPEHDEPRIDARLVAGVAMFGLARGLSMDELIAATGVDPTALATQEGFLPDQVMHELWRLLARRFPGEPLALQLASAAPSSIMGVFGHVLRYVDDLYTAMELFARYSNLQAERLEFELRDEPPHTIVRTYHPLDVRDRGLMAEFVFALGARLTREVFGEHGHALRVEFAHAPSAPLEDYERYFASKVLFEQPANQLVFETARLSAPVNLGNATMLDYLERHLEQAHAQMRPRAGVEDPLAQVRYAIRVNAQRGAYGAEPLAKRLAMSLRSLQRLTHEHGTSVQALLEQAREAHARTLLGDAKLSLQEVAFLLGYSTQRAFRRAFKRWTGETPSSYRASLGASPSAFG